MKRAIFHEFNFIYVYIYIYYYTTVVNLSKILIKKEISHPNPLSFKKYCSSCKLPISELKFN